MKPSPDTARAPGQVPLRIAVIGASGRLGRAACELFESAAGFELVARYASGDDWPSALARSGALVALEATRAGQGCAHGLAVLAAGVRPVVATSAVTPEQVAELDRSARAAGLGGIVVPNLSLGLLALERALASIAPLFAQAAIVETHHRAKRDAPSGTALHLARVLERAGHPGAPIHALRLDGTYARHEVRFGAPGESLSIEHDVLDPRAFQAGLALAARYAATARGVALGLAAAAPAAPRALEGPAANT